MDGAPETSVQYKKKKRLFGSVFAILILCGWFYWYQYRPTEIRSTCALDASSRAFFTNKEAAETKGIDRIRIENESFETYYMLCVRSKGLSN